MINIFIIILLIFVGQTLGSAVGLIKKPGKYLLYGSLAFAASMMLGISFIELIPESLAITPLIPVIISFLIGVLVLLIIDKTLPHINPELMKKENPSVKRSVNMLVIGIAIHNIPEGLAIGIGFALNPTLGLIIALGIAAQDVPENIATIIPLYALTGKKMKSFFITTFTILFELIGFLAGYYLLRNMDITILGALLSFAAGLMTYISVEELIPAIELKKNSKIGIIGFILGLICVYLITLIG